MIEHDGLKDLKADFHDITSAARNVLELKSLPSEGRIDNAAGRLERPYLTILLIGGTQVGKSTLLNALAGAPISITGQGAATTQNAVFYTPQNIVEADLPFKPGIDRRVAHSLPKLAGKVIIDAPDCDSYMLENKERSIELLCAADIVMVVTSWEKYNQMTLHQVLVPEIRGRSQASFVFIMNKMDDLAPEEEPAVVADFRASLLASGITDPTVFMISAYQGLEEKLGNVPPGRWLDRLRELEGFLQGKLDRKIKDSNLAHEVETGLATVVEGGDSGATMTALRTFLESATTAEMEFREGLRKVLEEVLSSHENSFLVTMRGIVGERMAGGFGTYLSALTYLRPSRLSSLLPIPGQRSPEQTLLDGVATSLASRLSHRLVDGISVYMRRIRSASKELREKVPLSERTRASLDSVGTEPMLAPETLFKKLRPGLESLTLMQVRPMTARLLNFPVFAILHAAPLILIYQFFSHLDPTRAVLWILTLPFVLISLLELERFVYEGMWLRGAVRHRVKALSAALEDSIMEALGEGALATPHQAQTSIKLLLDRHSSLKDKIALLTDRAQGG